MSFPEPDTLLLVLVLISGLYMAWNIGANDVANAMGTSVGSGALTLRQAVIIAAILEFSGAFFFGSHVTETVQRKIIDPSLFATDPKLLVFGMLSCLIASGAWLQIASYFGWPVSTTHSIIGALVGFGAMIGGIHAILWDQVFYIVTSWVLSPLFGGLISYYLFSLLRRHIFYVENPIAAAKKMTPPIVFFVIVCLMFILFYKGIEGVGESLSLFSVVSLALGAGSLGWIISFFLVRQIKDPKKQAVQNSIHPDFSKDLQKAKKYLSRVHAVSKGEMHYHISLLVDEVDHLTSSLEQEQKHAPEKSDYAVVEKIFGYLQIMSASMMAFAHGANDVANAIGPIAAALNVLTGGNTEQAVMPTWLLAFGGIGIVVGLATWGWRVIETIGKKITELTPTRGFTAEFGAALTILVASRLGMPVSTTHTLVGSVVGVGLGRGIEALDLSTTRDIVLSWVITVPAGALLAVGFTLILTTLF